MIAENLNENSIFNFLEKIWEEDFGEPFSEKKSSSKLILNELQTLLLSISSYDNYLADHSALVTKGCIIFAQELKYNWEETEKVAIAALLHDIGYIAIPKETFNKPGNLSKEEWKLIKQHPLIAYNHILNQYPTLAPYKEFILYHHEYIDGSGYPYGKKGDFIPEGSQIISMVDSYQAMKVDRPYRKALSFSEIIDVYIKNAGVKWDENLVTIFTALIADKEIEAQISGANITF